MVSMKRDSGVDLEIGGTASEEDRASGVSDGLLKLNAPLKGKVNGNSINNAGNFDEKALDKVELLIDKIPEDESCRERLALLEMKLKEKKKKCKVYKPPRPPKGPALDATDMKLVRELSELAMRKRMRNERVKALKKSRAANSSSSSSSNSSLTAMIITILFCLVIVFQGICSRGVSSVNRKGLHEQSSTANGEALISVQYPNNITPEQGREPSFGFHNLVEETPVSGSEEGTSREEA